MNIDSGMRQRLTKVYIGTSFLFSFKHSSHDAVAWLSRKVPWTRARPMLIGKYRTKAVTKRKMGRNDSVALTECHCLALQPKIALAGAFLVLIKRLNIPYLSLSRVISPHPTTMSKVFFSSKLVASVPLDKLSET